MENMKHLMAAYKEATARMDKIDAEYEANPENEAVEARWTEAYEIEHKAFTALVEALAALIGGDTKTTRVMLMKRFEDVELLIAG